MTEREYDYAGNMTAETVKYNDEEITSATYSYDGNGNLLSKTCGKITESYTYDGKNRIISSTSPNELETTYVYDSRDNLLSSTYILDNPEEKTNYSTNYSYDPAGNLTAVTDPEGNTTTYEYDGVGNVIKETSPYNASKGAFIKYEYDARNRLIETISVENGARATLETLTYDASGNVTKTQSGDISSTYVYDSAGNIISSTDGENNSVYYAYDGSGRIVSQTDGNGTTTTFDYYLNGLPKSVSYADGVTTTYTLSDFDLTGKYKVTSRDRMGDTIVTINNYFGDPVQISYYDYDSQEDIYKLIAAESFTYDSLGRMTTSTDRMGTVTYYEYDVNGNLTKKYFHNGDDEDSENLISESYTYSLDNLLVSYTDPEGNVTSYTYDKAGNLITASYPNGTGDIYYYDNGVLMDKTVNGVKTSYTYDTRGNVQTETVAETVAGRTTAYQYDSAGNVVKQINPDGGTVSYTYDNAGRLTKQTFGQSETQYDYDANGNVIEEVKNTTPASQKTYTYDEFNNVTQVSDNGVITTYEYDKLNRLVKVTQNSGGTAETFYDVMGNVYAERNAKGQITLYTYDALGRLLTTADSISDASIGNITESSDNYTEAKSKIDNYIVQKTLDEDEIGCSMTYTYDKMGNKLTETNALNSTNTYTYDRCGRVTKITYPDENTTQYTYDAIGNTTSVIDGNGNVTSYVYDNNRVVSEAVEGTVYKTYAYNDCGELASVTVGGETDGSGALVTAYTYDPCGRIKTVTVNTDETTLYSYDDEGNKIYVTDGNGNVTTHCYGNFNRLMSITDAEGIAESYEYDARGNLTRKVDGNGKEVTYTYDAKNNLTNVQYDDKIISYEYDELNNRTKMIDESGTYEYTYDDGNRLTNVSKDNNSYVYYTYDKLGNVTNLDGTAYTYDECNRMKTVGSVSYTYDNNGNLASTATPVGTTTYTYDERNRVTKVENTVDGDILSEYSYAYYNNNLEKSKTDQNGVQHQYAYDGAGRLAIVYWPEGEGTNVYHRYTYTYDKAGNRITYKNERLWTPAGNSGWELFGSGIMTLDLGYHYDCEDTSYLYDKANRLTMTSATTYYDDEITQTKIVRYVFDGAGNQISTAAEYLTPETTSTANETINIGYDSVVEVTINEYNGLNQLVNTTNIKDGNRTFASYVYNGDGLRVSKTVDGTTTDYIYSGGYVIAETGRTYVRGLSYHAVVDYTAYSGVPFYYFCNAHGDVTGVVATDGNIMAKYEYDEFGNLIEEEENRYFVGVNSVRYAGEFYDGESENYYLRARYYDPSIGRFTQQDTFLGVDSNPLSLNRYTYCHNNPIMYVDPSGHAEFVQNIGNLQVGYDGSQIKSSDDDYKFGHDLYLAQQEQITAQDFISRAAEMGVDVRVLGGYIGGGGGQSSNFIPAEYVQVIFNEQLSFENSITAASLFAAYNEGWLDEDGLKQQLNELSAMAIKYNETNYDIYGKGIYGIDENSLLQIVNGMPVYPTTTHKIAAYSDIKLYSVNIWDAFDSEEDLEYADKSVDELKEMQYITWSDFFMTDESDHLSHLKDIAKLTSMGELQDVALDMINHFADGTGTTYTNETLTQEVAAHPQTQQYMSDFTNIFVQELEGANWNPKNINLPDLETTLHENKVYFPSYGYGGGPQQMDTWTGLAICIHGWTECDVELTFLSVRNDSYNGYLNFTFRDNFGLDSADIENDKFGILKGFRSWYILQHNEEYNGRYKPFKTEVTVSYYFEGEI